MIVVYMHMITHPRNPLEAKYATTWTRPQPLRLLEIKSINVGNIDSKASSTLLDYIIETSLVSMVASLGRQGEEVLARLIKTGEQLRQNQHHQVCVLSGRDQALQGDMDPAVYLVYNVA